MEWRISVVSRMIEDVGKRGVERRGVKYPHLKRGSEVQRGLNKFYTAYALHRAYRVASMDGWHYSIRLSMA